LTILWLLDIDPRFGARSGSTLRYTNLSRRLVAAGHRVYYVVGNSPNRDREARRNYLDALAEAGCFTGHFELEAPAYSKMQQRLARVLIHPGARDMVLKAGRAASRAAFQKLLEQTGADLCIVSDRVYLFLAPELRHKLPIVIDWCDSETVYMYRDARYLLRSGTRHGVGAAIKNMFRAIAEEHFYGRRSTANVVVSAGDKKCLDRLNGKADRNRVLLNGVSAPEFADPPAKCPDTLIFTGNMSFPPNYQAALWFIDHVMPLLMERHPTVRLTIAGQEPVPELMAKAGGRIEVTAFIPDLIGRIAQSQLYVAPMQSGTGFRNKVVEALASGTYVIGTPMALEFLDASLRDKLLTAPTAASFADQILEFLKNPGHYSQRLEEASTTVRKEFSWEIRAAEMEALCVWAMQADRNAKMTY